MAAPGHVQSGYASVELPCRSAYGFATVYAELTAPRPDRPVTTVAYELADTGTAPRYLFAELVKRLGPPDDVSRDDSPGRANENSVVLHANWKRDKVEIGLSLYGAPRPSDFGKGLGKLYLSWAEHGCRRGALPPAWTSANQPLLPLLQRAPRLKVFSVRYAIYEDDTEPPSPATLALSTPELLLTPPAIAGRLGTDDVRAVERRAPSSRWHLSTARSTVLLGGPETSRRAFLRHRPGARRRLHGNRHGLLVRSRRPRIELDEGRPRKPSRPCPACRSIAMRVTTPKSHPSVRST